MIPIRTEIRGFTLIEIVVSLLIASILASIAAMGIVQGTSAFVFVRDSAAMSQKAQVALNRLTKEFTNLKEVTGVAGSAPSYTGATITILKEGEPVSRVIATSGASVTIDGHALVDTVSSFSLGLKKDDQSDWTIADLSREIVTVEITLALTTTAGETVTFINKLSPRYNENTGGATSPSM